MHNHSLPYAKKKKQKETDTHTNTSTQNRPIIAISFAGDSQNCRWLDWTGLDWPGLAWTVCPVVHAIFMRCKNEGAEQSGAKEPPVANKNCTALASNWRECKQTLCEQPTRERRTRVALPGCHTHRLQSPSSSSS